MCKTVAGDISVMFNSVGHALLSQLNVWSPVWGKSYPEVGLPNGGAKPSFFRALGAFVNAPDNKNGFNEREIFWRCKAFYVAIWHFIKDLEDLLDSVRSYKEDRDASRVTISFDAALRFYAFLERYQLRAIRVGSIAPTSSRQQNRRGIPWKRIFGFTMNIQEGRNEVQSPCYLLYPNM